MVKHPTPSPAVDVLIEEKEQNEKQKKETKETAGPPTQLPWTIQLPPTMHRNHTISYSELICFSHLAHKGNKEIYVGQVGKTNSFTV